MVEGHTLSPGLLPSAAAEVVAASSPNSPQIPVAEAEAAVEAAALLSMLSAVVLAGVVLPAVPRVAARLSMSTTVSFFVAIPEYYIVWTNYSSFNRPVPELECSGWLNFAVIGSEV